MIEDVPYEPDSLVYLVDSSVLYMDYPDVSSTPDYVVVDNSSPDYVIVDSSSYNTGYSPDVVYVDSYGNIIQTTSSSSTIYFD